MRQGAKTNDSLGPPVGEFLDTPLINNGLLKLLIFEITTTTCDFKLQYNKNKITDYILAESESIKSLRETNYFEFKDRI